MQGGQDILSMMGQLMKPKKTEITGETRRSAGGRSLAVRGILPLLTAGAALDPHAHPERETGGHGRIPPAAYCPLALVAPACLPG